MRSTRILGLVTVAASLVHVLGGRADKAPKIANVDVTEAPSKDPQRTNETSKDPDAISPRTGVLGLVKPKMSPMDVPADGLFASFIAAINDGPRLGAKLNECHNTVKDERDAIETSFREAATTFLARAENTSVADFGLTVIKAYTPGLADQFLMYQLYRTYLDQRLAKATDAPVSDAQKELYDKVTPECGKAFDSVLGAYSSDDVPKTASLLAEGASNNITTCKSFDDPARNISMSLCMFPAQLVTDKEGQTFKNITASFTNYGDKVCNVSFFVHNLDGSLLEEIPIDAATDAASAVVEGVPRYAAVSLSALVPEEEEKKDVTADDAKEGTDAAIPPNNTTGPVLFGLKDGWLACSQKSMEVPLQQPANVLMSMATCFQTDACTEAVSGAEKLCGHFQALLSSKCHACDSQALSDAKTQCASTCDASNCEVPLSEDDKAKTEATGSPSSITSPAGTITMSSMASWAVAATAALAALRVF